MRMNILIENAESREYLGNNGQWTKYANEGRDFGATQVAYEAATREPIGRFNIVCYILQKPKCIIITMDHGLGQGGGAPLTESPLAMSRPGHHGSFQSRRRAE
jgi:hypothetical protein